jgi:2-hydroxy-3-keto-5-methylthiopentenyl-1-phosphate phosphatase
MSTPSAQSTTSASRQRIAVLVDYDGTVATLDISDELVRRSASIDAWRILDSAYRRGEIGSRTLLEAETRLLPRDPSALMDLIDGQPHDEGFRPFADFARAHGVTVEVVSDGLGFFVPRGMEQMGLADLPVYTAEMDFGVAGATIRFPNGHPICRVCGTCKRERVLEHQAAGAHVVYVGDGQSDQYAAAYADTLFAKDDLAELCRARQIEFLSWTSFSEVQAWVERALQRPDLPPPRQRPYVCGPEAGDGGTQPATGPSGASSSRA